MKSIKQIVPGIVALALCGTAAAHSISADGWLVTPLGGTGTSVTVNPLALPEGLSLAGITSLSFSPGTGVSNPVNSSYVVQSLVNSSFPTSEDLYQWGTNPLTQQGVVLSATALNGASTFSNAPVLTISIGYTDYDAATNACGSIVGETASVTVNGNTYTAKNPCQLAPGTGDLTFVDGVLKAGTGVGWTLTKTAQAPELDSASAAGGLTLLLGSLLVVRGRRTQLRAGRLA